MRRRLPRPSHATVVAYLALFVALGSGSAYAINEWTGANIVDESLTGADVKGKAAVGATPGVNGTLTGADISGQSALANGQRYVNGSLGTWDLTDSSILGRDVKDEALTGADIAESTLWTVPAAYEADHAILADSARSVAKAPLEGYEQVTGSDSSNVVRREAAVTVPCPAGRHVVGGGGSASGGYLYNDAIAIVESRPAGYNQWYVRARTTVEHDVPWNSGVNVTGYAICAKAVDAPPG
jgi:hypothetical protein